jgi:uncharacterized protein YkwD
VRRRWPPRRRRFLLSLAASLVLPLGTFGAFALSQNGADAAAVGDCTPGGGWGALRPDLGAGVLRLVNAHRTAVGRAPLSTSSTLQRAAEWKSLHMGHYGYMQHDDPAPPLARSVGERLAACGYRGSGYGENIAYGYPTAEAVVQGWLSSPGHRANIESSGFTSIGIGVARGSRGMMTWTQNFGRDSAAAAAPVTTPSPPRSRAAARPAPGSRDSSRAARPALASSQLEAGRLMRTASVGPQAGHKFTTRIRVGVRGTGTQLTLGHVRCPARVAGRPVWVRVHGVRNGRASCTFRVPSWARGNYLTGTIHVSARGQKTVRWFSRKVH